MTGLFPLALGACSSGKTSLNPVDWWRDLQGGKIAEERPAPPGANDPEPNLGSVPERPTPTDPKFREQLANALIADRTNAQHVGGSASDPSNPASAPGLFGRGTAQPPGPAPAAAPPPAKPSQAEEGAAAQPAPTPSGIAGAPVGSVQAAPLPDQNATNEAAPAPAELPPLPGAPPAAANLPGAPSSAPVRSSGPDAAAIAAAEVPPAATQTATTAAAVTGAAPPAAPVSLTFGPGSATLPRNAPAVLRQFAAKRGGAAIAVTGYGDATSGEPSAQSAALALGLARGQAIANALISAGVPANNIRVDAEASGRGGTVRLVE